MITSDNIESIVQEIIDAHIAREEENIDEQHALGEKHYRSVLEVIQPWMRPYLHASDGEWPILRIPNLAPIHVLRVGDNINYRPFVASTEDNGFPVYRSNGLFATDDLGWAIYNARDEYDRYRYLTNKHLQERTNQGQAEHLHTLMISSLNAGNFDMASAYALSLTAHLRYTNPMYPQPY